MTILSLSVFGVVKTIWLIENNNQHEFLALHGYFGVEWVGYPAKELNVL